MFQTKNDVIIVGVDHHNTLGMIRCFAMVDIHVILLLYECHKSYIEKAKNIKEVYYFNSPESAIEYLKNSIPSRRGSIIISCTDTISLLLNENTSFKSAYKYFDVASGVSIRDIMNKYTQMKLAEDVGLSIPNSKVFMKNKFVNCEDDLMYPCIIKPLASVDGGKLIKICHSRIELQEAFQIFDGKDMLVQNLLDRESEIVILGLALENEIILPAYIEKIRDFKGGTTYSKVHSIDSLSEDFLNKVAQFVKRTTYHGLFGIEFICCDDGLYFIEINLRNDATTYSAAVAGLNLPYIYYLSMLGLDVSAEQSHSVEEIYSIVEINDFFHAVGFYRLSLTNWFREYKQSKCRYYSAREDNLLMQALFLKIRNKLK